MSRKERVFLITIVLAFMTGVLVMSYEILASRIIAPLLGSSIYTWSAIIAMVLSGATIGIWLGGWLPHRYARTFLPLSYLIAALSIGGGWFLSSILREFIAASQLGLPALSIVIAAILTFVQTLALSFGGPLFIGFITETVEHVGKRYGALSIAGSLGSIIGVFIGGFIFVPIIGISGSILILVSASTIMFLLALTLVSLPKKYLAAGLFLAVILGSWLYNTNGLQSDDAAIFRKDSPYYQIHVYDTSIPSRPSTQSRWLFLDFDSHSVDTGGVLTGSYTELVRIAPVLRPETRNALMLGAGAYVMPRMFLNVVPDGMVDVFEIDPALESVSERYFGLEKYPNITTTVGDPRYLLPRTDKQYDLIINDIFNSFISIPSHVTTQEFFTEVSRHLTNDGLYLMNIIAAGEGDEHAVMQHIFVTAREVFGDTRAIFFGTTPEKVSNFVLLASPSALPYSDKELTALIQKQPGMARARVVDIDTEGVRPITDSWQPLESMMRPIMEQYFPAYKDLYYSVTS